MVNLDGMKVICGKNEKTKNYKYHRKKDIFPYDIVGGNPAKKISERFSSSEINLHELELYGKKITQK